MASAYAALRAAVTGDGPRRTLTLDAAFQGLPDTAHGGTLLALFDALAIPRGARHVAAHYRRRVPVATPLALEIDATARAFAVRDDDGIVVDGRVEANVAAAVGERADPTPRPVLDDEALPVSRTCFACGVDNPLGLRARLAATDDRVWTTWTPAKGFARDDGTLAPLAITTLLDEAAFWLGALATGESGMTTELAVTLEDDIAADTALTVVGERAAVRARTADPRYWDTAITALDPGGRVVASAAITFVAVRGAARRLVAGLLETNPPATLRRVFPAYARR